VSSIHPWFIARFAAIYAMEEQWRDDPTLANLEAARHMGSPTSSWPR